MAVKTRGLTNLGEQLDEAFPDRHRPDGWIGNRAHMGKTSGHNADDTPGSKPAWNADPDQLAEVRALDVAADLGSGVDSQDVVDHLIDLPGFGSVIRYVIHRGLIYHSRTGFEAEDYDGDNGHFEHIHFEGAWTQAADNNTTFDFRLQEVPVALTTDDKKWIAAEIRTVVTSTMTGALGDVVPRWTDSGDQVPATDKNPTMGPSSALHYIGRTVARIEKTLKK